MEASVDSHSGEILLPGCLSHRQLSSHYILRCRKGWRSSLPSLLEGPNSTHEWLNDLKHLPPKTITLGIAVQHTDFRDTNIQSIALGAKDSGSWLRWTNANQRVMTDMASVVTASLRQGPWSLSPRPSQDPLGIPNISGQLFVSFSRKTGQAIWLFF